MENNLNPGGNPIWSLYDGTVQLEFDKVKHWYFANGAYTPSVTGITGYLDKSGPLMSWAVKKTVEYFQSQFKAGTVVDEVQLEKIFKDGKTHFRDVVEAAASVGGLIHGWIEEHIKAQINNTKGPELPINARINNGAQAFLKWEKENKLKYVKSECKVYSKKYNYAGTCDLVCKVNGKLAVVDFKTGGGPYYDHVLQTAAYQQALTEELKWRIKERWLLKIGKDDGEFQAHRAELYKEDFEAFKSLLKIYLRHKFGVLTKEKPKTWRKYL